MPSRMATVTGLEPTQLLVRLNAQCDDCAACRGRCARWFGEQLEVRLPRVAVPQAHVGDRLRIHAADPDLRRLALRHFGWLTAGALLGAALGAALAPSVGVVTDGMSAIGALAGIVLASITMRSRPLRRRGVPTWLNIEVVDHPL